MKGKYSRSSGNQTEAKILLKMLERNKRNATKKIIIIIIINEKKKANATERLSEWEKRQQKDKMIPDSVSNIVLQLEFILHLF